MIKKISLLLILFVSLFCVFISFEVNAYSNRIENGWNIKNVKVSKSYVNDDNSILNSPNGYVINYSNFTRFNNSIEEAINQWNNLELIKLQPSKKNISLFFIEKNLGANNLLSSYIVNDCYRYIIVNSYYLVNLTENERSYVLKHEIGHALGLFDISDNNNIKSIMKESFNINNNSITINDVLFLTEVLSRENATLNDSSFLTSNQNLCFANTNENYNNPTSCEGGGGSSGSPYNSPPASQLVIEYTNKIQSVLDFIENNDIANGLNAFENLIPGALVYDFNGTTITGVYATLGGLWYGTSIIMVGGTIGIQLVKDSYNNIALQLFIGTGIHLLPHLEVVAYRMDYSSIINYTELEGFSAQFSGSLANAGLQGEYLFIGGYWGFGYSVSLINIDLNIPANFIAEVQYTETLWSTGSN